MGAAFLAGIGVGFWKPGAAIKDLHKSDKRFDPVITDQARQEMYRGWQDAVSRCGHFSKKI
jgi:glycerol kinase